MSAEKEKEEGVLYAYPAFTGFNWPGTILETLLRLRDLGVPMANVRLLPEFGHFAQPEVMERSPEEDQLPAEESQTLRFPAGDYPRSPAYDSEEWRLHLDAVVPERLRPRFTVNVRAEPRTRVIPDAEVPGGQRTEEWLDGRLAPFCAALIAGLPGAPEEEPDSSESLLNRLVRQVCVAYPELVRGIPPEARRTLDFLLERLEIALAGLEREELTPATAARPLAQSVPRNADLPACRAALETVTRRFSAADPGMADDADRLRTLGEVLLLADGGLRSLRLERLIEATPLAARNDLRERSVPAARRELERDAEGGGEQIVRELVEILVTEALQMAALADLRWGAAWSHGTEPRGQGQSLSIASLSGGQDVRSVLAKLIRIWMTESGFLGIASRTSPLPEDCRDADVFTPAERQELTALLAWRREVTSPTALFVQAARRLVHPGIMVRQLWYVPAPTRLGTPLAQPRATAVLNGRGYLRHPGLEIRIPVNQDADDPEAEPLAARVRLLISLFLPVTFRVEVVWREMPARLDRPAYLRHPFQRGLRLSPAWSGPPPGDLDPLPKEVRAI